MLLGVFKEAQDRLHCHIVNYGYLESRDHYHEALATADVAVSTALHEFFGVAMYVLCYAFRQRLVPVTSGPLIYSSVFQPFLEFNPLERLDCWRTPCSDKGSFYSKWTETSFSYT